MKVLSIISFFVLLISCSETPQRKQTLTEHRVKKVDPPPPNQKYGGYQDSLIHTVVDTSNIRGKHEYLRNQFLINQSPSAIDYDTILDYNFDGTDDYVIGYYGQSGTGIKNRIFAYKFLDGSYHFDSLISSIPNPYFQLKQKRITGFYIAYGAGWGKDLRWKNGEWVTHMEFTVENTGEHYEDDVIWSLHYPSTGRDVTIEAPYQFIPPEIIIPTNIK